MFYIHIASLGLAQYDFPFLLYSLKTIIFSWWYILSIDKIKSKFYFWVYIYNKICNTWLLYCNNRHKLLWIATVKSLFCSSMKKMMPWLWVCFVIFTIQLLLKDCLGIFKFFLIFCTVKIFFYPQNQQIFKLLTSNFFNSSKICKQ